VLVCMCVLGCMILSKHVELIEQIKHALNTCSRFLNV